MPTTEELIRQEAARQGVPPDLALAIADVESSLKPDTPPGPKLPSGEQAIGLFQVLPSTARARGFDPNDPFENLQGGIGYIRELLDKHQGDRDKVIAEYGGVVHDKAYVPKVLDRISKFGGADTRTATAPPSGVLSGMVAPSTAKGDPNPLTERAKAIAKSRTDLPPDVRKELEALGTGSNADAILANVGSVAKGFGSAIAEPIQALGSVASTAYNKGLGAAGEQLYAGMVEPTVSHLKAAGQAALEGRLLNKGEQFGAAEHLVRAVPMIPGMVESVVGAEDVPEGVGRALGIGATIEAPKALGRVRVNKMEGMPVPLLRGERTGSGFSQFVEHLGERTLPGAGVFRLFRQRQQTALAAEGERLASEISALPTTGPELTQAVTNAIDKTLADRKAEAATMYEQIDRHAESQIKRVPVTREVPSRIVGPSGEPLTVTERKLKKVDVGGVKPDTTVLKQVAIPMLRRVLAEGVLMEPAELSRVTGILKRVAFAPHHVTFSVMQDFRSDLLKLVRSHGDPIPGRAGGAAKLLAKSADTAMMDAAESSGIAELPALVREANAAWHEAVDIYNEPFIKKILDESPEKVPALIRAGTMDDLAKLKKAVPEPIFKMAAANIFREILKEATPEAATPTARSLSENLGLTAEGVPVTAPPITVKGAKITAALKNLGYEKSVALFGKTAVDGLDDMAFLAERISPKQTSRIAGGLIAAGINASILSPVLRPFGIPFGSLPYTMSTAAGINIAARIMTNPEGFTTLRRFVRAMGTGNTPNAIALGAQLARQVQHKQDEMDSLLKQRQAPVAP